MKLLKKRNLWFSVLTGLAFAAVIYPYNHNMYIAAAFTYVCAIMNLFSAAVFSVLLYFLLEKRFPMDSLGSVVMFLLVQIPGHMLFAAINWGSWACLALVAAWLVYCWISWRRIHPLTRVQKKRRCIAALVLLVLGGCLCGYYSSPVLRVRVFLMQYQDMLEARIEAAGGDINEVEAKFLSNPMPVLSGIQRYDVWPGDHDSIEFHLFGSGLGSQTSYYGCYYSFDDVPLPYCYATTDLVQEGENYWTWLGEGDNHGATRKLSDHWYYFEAYF